MSTDAVHETRERLFAECKLELLLPLRGCEKVEGQDGDSSNAIVDLSDVEPQRKCIILDEYFDCIVKAELPSELTGAAAFLDSAQLDVTLDVCELLAPKTGRDPLSHSLSQQPNTRQHTLVEPDSGASTPGFPFTSAPQAQDTQGHEDFQDFITGRSLLSSEVKPERHGVSGRSDSAYTLWYFRRIRIAHTETLSHGSRIALVTTAVLRPVQPSQEARLRTGKRDLRDYLESSYNDFTRSQGDTASTTAPRLFQKNIRRSLPHILGLTLTKVDSSAGQADDLATVCAEVSSSAMDHYVCHVQEARLTRNQDVLDAVEPESREATLLHHDSLALLFNIQQAQHGDGRDTPGVSTFRNLTNTTGAMDPAQSLSRLTADHNDDLELLVEGFYTTEVPAGPSGSSQFASRFRSQFRVRLPLPSPPHEILLHQAQPMVQRNYPSVQASIGLPAHKVPLNTSAILAAHNTSRLAQSESAPTSQSHMHPHFMPPSNPRLSALQRSFSAAAVPSMPADRPAMAQQIGRQRPTRTASAIFDKGAGQLSGPSAGHQQAGSSPGITERHRTALNTNVSATSYPNADLAIQAEQNLLAISAKFILASNDGQDLSSLSGGLDEGTTDALVLRQLQSFEFGKQNVDVIESSTDLQMQKAPIESPTDNAPEVLLRVKPLDVFFIEFFIFNNGSHTENASFLLRPSKDTAGWTLATPLDAKLSFGPLRSKSCQMVRGRFLALRPGISTLHEIWLDVDNRRYSVALKHGLQIKIAGSEA